MIHAKRKFVGTALLAAIFSSLAIGCGTSSNEEGSTQGIVATNPSGDRVRVCADTNEDYRCGEGEAQAVPNSNGAFSLPVKAGRVVAEFFAENNSSHPSNILIGGPENGYFISPLTTLVYVHGQKNARPLGQSEIDMREQLKAPSEMPSFMDNYQASGAKQNANAARVMLAYQTKRFDMAGGEIDRPLEESVVSDFAASSVDLSDAAAVSALEDGATGGAFGAIPALSDLPIIQGMDLGVGYDVLSDRIKSAAQCVVTLGQSDIQKRKVINRNDVQYEFRLIRNRQDLTNFFAVGAGVGVVSNDFDLSVFFGMIKKYEQNSNKLYAAVKVDARVADIQIEKPVLIPAAQDLFVADYEKFRKKCGDQFLNVITVGGAYYGLIELEASTIEDKLAIEADLSLEVKGSTKVNVDVGFSMLMKNALNRRNTSVTIHSSGVPAGYAPVTDYPSFMVDLTRFYCNLRGVTASACEQICKGVLAKAQGSTSTVDDIFTDVDSVTPELEDPNPTEADGTVSGPIRQAIYAKFEDYGQIFDAVRSVDIIAKDYNKKLLTGYYNDYYALLEEVREMLVFPTLYSGLDDPATEAAVRSTRDQLIVNLENIKRILDKCSHPITSVCEEVTDKTQVLEKIFGVKADPAVDYSKSALFAAEIRRALPARKEPLPRTCNDIKNKASIAKGNEGEFMLYLHGDVNLPYWAYCTRLNEEGVMPESYLVVRNRSVLQRDLQGRLVELPNFNYSMYKNLALPLMEENLDESGACTTLDPGTNKCALREKRALNELEYSELDSGSLISAYQMLKVLINYDSLVIDPNQTQTVSSDGSVEQAPSVVNYGSSVVEYRRVATSPASYTLDSIYSHAPLGWTKVCGRNLDIGSAAKSETEEGTVHTANIDLTGTPFVLSTNLQMATNVRFEPMYNRVTGDLAKYYALDLNGKLLVLSDQKDADYFAGVLKKLGFDGVWLNLEAACSDNVTVANWQVDTVQFNPLPPMCTAGEFAEHCSLLTPVEVDGVVRGNVTMVPCSEAHPYLVEYSKAKVDYKLAPNRQTLDIWASHIYGDCVTVYPMRELVLAYDSSIAKSIGLTKE